MPFKLGDRLPPGFEWHSIPGDAVVGRLGLSDAAEVARVPSSERCPFCLGPLFERPIVTGFASRVVQVCGPDPKRPGKLCGVVSPIPTEVRLYTCSACMSAGEHGTFVSLRGSHAPA